MLIHSFDLTFRRLLMGLAAAALFMLLTPSSAAAQEQTQTTAATQTAAATKQTTTTGPLFRDYKGVSVGMSVDEVRGKLGKPAEKFDEFDIFVFSDKERARVYYDKEKKARAVSVTYVGTDAAPKPADVLGTEVERKEDGSMHKLVTYPEAGYWVSYSRTAGDQPLVMITMQKTR
ncbi:MAG TPA: hypothetical protein VJT74_16515 [Pyrinomonadaceae bacterium]|nr:hypothetical protein [Pyrinomonadaceae bacterium]